MNGNNRYGQELSPADQLLVKLIQFDTSTGISPEKPAMDYVRELLETAGIETRTFAKDEDRPNLLAVLRGEEKAGEEKLPALLLYGHMDVVPVTGQNWKEEPYPAPI